MGQRQKRCHPSRAARKSTITELKLPDGAKVEVVDDKGQSTVIVDPTRRGYGVGPDRLFLGAGTSSYRISKLTDTALPEK